MPVMAVMPVMVTDVWPFVPVGTIATKPPAVNPADLVTVNPITENTAGSTNTLAMLQALQRVITVPETVSSETESLYTTTPITVVNNILVTGETPEITATEARNNAAQPIQPDFATASIVQAMGAGSLFAGTAVNMMVDIFQEPSIDKRLDMLRALEPSLMPRHATSSEPEIRR